MRAEQRLRLRDARRAAGPLGTRARARGARPPPPPRARRRSALRGHRARRRTRPGGRPADRRIHRTARARARDARSDRLRPARHGLLGRALVPTRSARAPTSARSACSSPRARRSSGPRAPSTRASTRSPTSKRSASPAATKSSFSTARPTARRSRSSTRSYIPNTSKRSCSTPSSRRAGPNR